jgi:hypothetical protein
MNSQVLIIASCFLFLFFTSFANATSYTFDVDAVNDSSGGSGLVTGISLSTGQLFSVSTDPTDLWSSGALPRWSNADGLVADLYATGSDESGVSAGTLIGTDWGNYSFSGLTAPYGSLVGEIDGNYYLLGTSFFGNAWAVGDLSLYYWDSNPSDNANFISVTINDQPAPVPEPSTILLLGSGLACLGFYARKRKKE